ncbi:hypothetical protein ACFE04_029778 [Oxalis oulophora]
MLSEVPGSSSNPPDSSLGVYMNEQPSGYTDGALLEKVNTDNVLSVEDLLNELKDVQVFEDLFEDLQVPSECPQRLIQGHSLSWEKLFTIHEDEQTEQDHLDSRMRVQPFYSTSPNASLFKAGLESILMLSELPGSSSNSPSSWLPGQECNDASSLLTSLHGSSMNSSFGVYENEQKRGTGLTVHDPIDVDGVNPSIVSFEDLISEQNVQVASDCSQRLIQEQLFSIYDFLPGWGLSGTATKVIIVGKFLENEKFPRSSCIKWGCMFGDIEVSAQLLAENVIQCEAPPQAPGRVAFFITCGDRLACSEVKEFQYVDRVPEDDVRFQSRLAKLLFSGSNERKWLESKKLFRKDALIERLLKEKLSHWLVYRVHKEGKGPEFQGEGGLGVIHFAAALGYEWAMAPIVNAGVNINFQDKHGRTALHWASYFGREETVIRLVRLGAHLGAVDHGGNTAADLAYSQGHKGIAGYFAEAYLKDKLSSLAAHEVPLDVSKEPKGPLAAVQNSAHVAASIREMIRTISCHHRQLEKSSSHEITDHLATPNKVPRMSMKETLAGVEKALSRVQSMASDPKAHDQYTKLQNLNI